MPAHQPVKMTHGYDAREATYAPNHHCPVPVLQCDRSQMLHMQRSPLSARVCSLGMDKDARSSTTVSSPDRSVFMPLNQVHSPPHQIIIEEFALRQPVLELQDALVTGNHNELRLVVSAGKKDKSKRLRTKRPLTCMH